MSVVLGPFSEKFQWAQPLIRRNPHLLPHHHRHEIAFEDREESFEAGDAFFTPPCHVPVKHEPGSEVVMFSPAEELHKTEAVMMKNMQATQAATV